MYDTYIEQVLSTCGGHIFKHLNKNDLIHLIKSNCVMFIDIVGHWAFHDEYTHYKNIYQSVITAYNHSYECPYDSWLMDYCLHIAVCRKNLEKIKLYIKYAQSSNVLTRAVYVTNNNDIYDLIIGRDRGAIDTIHPELFTHQTTPDFFNHICGKYFHHIKIPLKDLQNPCFYDLYHLFNTWQGTYGPSFKTIELMYIYATIFQKVECIKLLFNLHFYSIPPQPTPPFTACIYIAKILKNTRLQKLFQNRSNVKKYETMEDFVNFYDLHEIMKKLLGNIDLPEELNILR